MTRDVVCGMQIEPATAAGMGVYRGQTLFFCAPGCKKAFDTNPEQFVRENKSMSQHRSTVQFPAGTPEGHGPRSETIIKNTSLGRITMYLKSRTVVALLAIGAAGCSNDSSSPMGMTPSPPAYLTVDPADGQANVRLDAGITFTFARPVDRTVVERNLHIISERSMADSLCPDTTMMGHGGMNGVMTDSSMMHHMGQVHATPGRFTWNGSNTQCYFTPDSLMTPLTTYMIHTGPEMMQMMRARMGDMGTMGGHGFGMMQNDMMFHFVTIDTSGTGGGHGHH